MENLNLDAKVNTDENLNQNQNTLNNTNNNIAQNKNITNWNTEKQIYLFKSVSLIDKFNFYEYLSIMLDWGLTITQWLDTVEQKIKNEFFKEKIRELHLFISSWDSFNKAMKKLPDVFNQSEYFLVEAGEKSWTLVSTLSSMALEFKKLYELKQTIKWALTYPIIIIVFLVVAILIVMNYVVPSIIPLIDSSWVEKPFATVALIATSNFISNNFLWIIILMILFFLSIYLFKSSNWWKRFFDWVFLKLPLVWDVYRNYIIASSASILWVLMNAWIPIVKTILLVWKTTNNVIYEDLFEKLSIKVWSWKKIVESIIELDNKNEYFPSDFLQLLSVGEKTASVNKVCKKINEQYTREVNYSLNNLTKWIEPLAIFFAGIFVLWFAFAIFWAILKVTETVW